jgi:hypothetical protein
MSAALRNAAQQALKALKDCVKALDALHAPGDSIYTRASDSADRAEIALRDALAQQEPRNQCGETCERAKLCAVCARGLDGATQTPCDIAEDGVCEVCRKSPLILEALEIGYDSAQAEAAQYHAAMAGYRPERHAEMDADVQKIAKAITAVKAALAQEEQEPVLVVEQEPDYMSRGHFYEGSKPFIDPTEVWKLPIGTKLYTNPPRREWHSLTDKEIRRMGIETPGQQGGWNLVFARAVEAALKEKNA